MGAIVFEGVSPRSLGDLLKGYGIMAVVGEEYPETLFWWDGAFHLVLERPCDDGKSADVVEKEIEELLRDRLTAWATDVAGKFTPRRGEKCGNPLPCPYHGLSGARKGRDSCQESSLLLRTRRFHDELEPQFARLARAVALPLAEPMVAGPAKKRRPEADPHPLFPGHGQEGSGNYFEQLRKAARAAQRATADLSWSLFARGTPRLGARLESGYLFFPEPMKRPATGIREWQEDRSAMSPWCFLLAIRGALLLRGSLRRSRWRQQEAYAAFPFVYQGATVELGRGKFFKNVEIHLPTWSGDHPRTLAEFEMQVRGFQARLSGRVFATTAAEFRVAAVGKGTGAAFDTFHRFVLEMRREQQGGKKLPQAIPRGLTRVARDLEASGKLRLMLAPIAETGWFDQFTTDRLRAKRARAEEAIHRAVDEPGLEAYRGVLEALWDLNRSIILPGALRRGFEDADRIPRPLPPLPARLWEEALREGLERERAYRLGRAIGSILGVNDKNGAAVGPVLEHMLPVKYDWDPKTTYGWNQKTWTIPDRPSSRPLRWSGLDPLRDFRTLLWYRWLDSAELQRLPFEGARCAPLSDVVALLRGEVDVREVHRLTALFALLDWQKAPAAPGGSSGPEVPVPPAYAVLRLWLELGIHPAPESRPPRDGEVVRLLNIGQPAQVQRAVTRALSRLRVNGLPWCREPRPTGKAVAHFEPEISDAEAARLAVAVIVPIAKEERRRLASRLWVDMDEGREETP